MFVAATLAQLGMKDSARRVMESARTSDKKIDPSGNLLTYEAMNRLRLGTPEDTTEAFRLLKDYVVSQPTARALGATTGDGGAEERSPLTDAVMSNKCAWAILNRAGAL
jgi:hypothetical protein